MKVLGIMYPILSINEIILLLKKEEREEFKRYYEQKMLEKY